MNGRDDIELDLALRSLPQRRAPATLVPRVREAIRGRRVAESRNWLAIAGAAAGLAVAVVLIAAGAGWLDLGLRGVVPALREPEFLGTLRALTGALDRLAAAARLVVHLVSPGVWITVAAVVGLLWGLGIGAGSALWRLARAPSGGAREVAS